VNFFQEFLILGCFIDVTKQKKPMKKFVSTKVASMDRDQEIQKMLRNNDRILVGLMIFMTTQLVLILSIF